MLQDVYPVSMTWAIQSTNLNDFGDSYLLMVGGVLIMIIGVIWAVRLLIQDDEKKVQVINEDIHNQIHSTVQNARSPRVLRPITDMPTARTMHPSSDSDSTLLLDQDQTTLMDQSEVETSIIVDMNLKHK